MNFFKLLIAQINRILRTKEVIVSMVAFTFLGIAFVFMYNSPFKNSNSNNISETHTNKAIVWGKNNEALKSEMIEKKYKPAFETSLDRAKDRLDTGDVSIIYEIPDSYVEKLVKGQKEEIKIYVRKTNNRSQLFETEFSEVVNKEVEKEILKSNGIYDKNKLKLDYDNYFDIQENKENTSFSAFSIMSLMIVYILLNTSSISGDLALSRENKMIKRMLLSPNKSLSITSSFLLSHFLVLSTLNILVVLMYKKIYGFNQTELVTFIISILLMTLFTISLGISIFRIFKNKVILGIAGVVIPMLIIGMTLAGDVIENAIIKKISYLSPLTWVFEIITKQVLFPNIIIVILMSLVLLTMGSYKLEKYVKN